MGPGAAFTDQDIFFEITVSNVGSKTATNVIVSDRTTFLSSIPSGVVSDDIFTSDAGDIAAGKKHYYIFSIPAPSSEGVLTSQPGG